MPYIVIRRYQADTDYRGEMHREVHGFFLPRISRAPGFMAYYALEDVGHDAFVSISVFENRKTAEASNKLAAEFLREWGPGLRKRTPEIIAAGEVGPWQVRQQGEVKADQSQLAVLSLGAGPWNKWRERNPRKEVRLSGAYLSGADLSSVDLSGADLSGADLSAALRGGPLTQEQIEQAIGNEQTKLPEHLKPPASWSQSSNDQQTGDK
jgi:Pentapeptide repeats (8 copies)